MEYNNTIIRVARINKDIFIYRHQSKDNFSPNPSSLMTRINFLEDKTFKHCTDRQLQIDKPECPQLAETLRKIQLPEAVMIKLNRIVQGILSGPYH